MTSEDVKAQGEPLESLANMSDRELLQYWGFKSHQIIDLPDGGAILNAEILKIDMLINRLQIIN